MWKCSKCGAECDGDICQVCGQPCEEVVEEEAVEEAAEEVTAEATEKATDDNADEESAISEILEKATDEITDAEESPEDEDNDAVIDLSETSEELEMPKVWICPACGTENEDDLCDKCGEVKPEGYNIVDFAPKKKNGKVIALAALVIAVVVLTGVLFVRYFLNRNLKATGENGAVTYEDLMDTSDGIFGDDAVLVVNDVEVPANIFESYLTTAGLYYQQDYCYNEMGQFDSTKLDTFKWTDIADKKTGKTHREAVIEKTVNDCLELYTIISIGQKHNIKASDEDIAAIDAQIQQYKDQYGKDFAKVLKLNGYSSEKHFKDLLKIDALVSAIVTDLQEHPERYITEDPSVYALENPATISAKHILITVDEENGVDDAAAKKQAEKILKEIKAGANFDNLIKEYNQDTGQPEEGYAFAKGQMVAEFETAAFALKPGEVSDLVKSEFGYHIIKRHVGYMDVINYEKSVAKVRVNRSLLKKLEVKSDLKGIQEASTN